MIKSVEDLDVYKKAHEITLKLYKITKDFPNDEKLGLVSQIRRAAEDFNYFITELDAPTLTPTHTLTPCETPTIFLLAKKVP